VLALAELAAGRRVVVQVHQLGRLERGGQLGAERAGAARSDSARHHRLPCAKQARESETKHALTEDSTAALSEERHAGHGKTPGEAVVLRGPIFFPFGWPQGIGPKAT